MVSSLEGKPHIIFKTLVDKIVINEIESLFTSDSDLITAYYEMEGDI